jgi:hypothetical protein
VGPAEIGVYSGADPDLSTLCARAGHARAAGHTKFAAQLAAPAQRLPPRRNVVAAGCWLLLTTPPFVYKGPQSILAMAQEEARNRWMDTALVIIVQRGRRKTGLTHDTWIRCSNLR